MDKTIKIGDKAFISKTFSEEDVFRFAGLSNETGPHH
jgi:hypothetical protein